MFGYVIINKPELKIKDYNRYHAYYCGLCHTLKNRYGFLGQMTLTYDMTFLVLLLSSLYETETSHKRQHCLVHPVKKHDLLINEISEYAADMNIALAYHHFLDDWQDEKQISGLAGATFVKTKYKKIAQKYPRQCNKIEQSLKELQLHEKNMETSLDVVAGCFGNLMAELFAYKNDYWEESLRKIGFFLGKFIYLMDACLDVDKDRKNHSYNPLLPLCQKEDYEEFCYEMLSMMIAEATNEFEKLPCIVDIDILRNILYGGVWVKYNNALQKKRKETTI